MKGSIPLFVFLFGSVAGSGLLHGQGFGRPEGGPGGRQHTATEAQALELVPANRRPPSSSEYAESEVGILRGIAANGIPDHRVGEFPNRNNPNEIREQAYEIAIPLDPEPAPRPIPLHGAEAAPGLRIFGISLDGVLMEPGTAETWMGRRDSGWNYEALGGAVPLGLDENFGHVQPDGTYHYHGIPYGLMERLGYREGQHSPQIGWAADGYPIYALYGYADPQDPTSEIVELKTGYRLREGSRPVAPDGPGGRHDGAFVQDYEFAGGEECLDECNGRYCVTPEFPDGTYAYFMTREWPVIPRAFRGVPENLKPVGSGRQGSGPDGRAARRDRGEGKGRPPGSGPRGDRPPFPPPPR